MILPVKQGSSLKIVVSPNLATIVTPNHRAKALKQERSQVLAHGIVEIRKLNMLTEMRAIKQRILMINLSQSPRERQRRSVQRNLGITESANLRSDQKLRRRIRGIVQRTEKMIT